MSERKVSKEIRLRARRETLGEIVCVAVGTGLASSFLSGGLQHLAVAMSVVHFLIFLLFLLDYARLLRLPPE